MYSFRQNNILQKTGAYLAPVSGASVTVYSKKALTSSTQTGTSHNVYSSHTLSGTGGRFGVWDGTTFTYGGSANLITAVAASSVTFTNSLTITAGSIIIDLGADTGASVPAFDGSTAAPSSDPNGNTTLTNATTTTDSGGNYSYYYSLLDPAEVVHNAAGTVLGVEWSVGATVLSPPSSTASAIAKWSGTDGRTLANSTITDSSGTLSLVGITASGAVSSATVTTTGAATIGGAASVAGALSVTGAGTAFSVTNAASIGGALTAGGLANLQAAALVGTTLFVGTNLSRGATTAITASATHTQNGATALVSDFNFITGGAAGDTVRLPSASGGMKILVRNDSGAALTLYPASGDDAGAGVNGGVTINTATTYQYVAKDSTTWLPL